MPRRVVYFGHDKKKRQPEKLPFACIDYIITMCYNLFD
jgi:hypothetical protein